MHRDTRPFDADAPDATDLSEAVRRACVQAAIAAWEDAGIRGLCGEGRWEVAVDAMCLLDLGPVLDRARAGPAERERGVMPEGR